MARGDFHEDELEDDDVEDDEEADFDGLPDEDEDDEDEYLSPMTPADSVEILAAARQAAEPRWLGADGLVRMPVGDMTCRVCGCRDSQSCPGGCVWAAPNLCSRCVA